MNKKTIFAVFSVIGLVSLFLPFSENIVTGCGDNGCFTDYYYESLIDFFKSSSYNNFNFFDFLALIVVVLSIVFSPVLLFFDKMNSSIFLTVIALLILFIPFYNSSNFLGYGYYLIFLQQTVLLIVGIISKNKILHLQKL